MIETETITGPRCMSTSEVDPPQPYVSDMVMERCLGGGKYGDNNISLTFVDECF